MNKYTDIAKLDWKILDALADDFESIEQIQQLINDTSTTCATKQEILGRLEYLHENNYVYLINNKTFDKTKLQDEIAEKTQARFYWFGRTEHGYLAWQELTEKYFEDTEPKVAPERQ